MTPVALDITDPDRVVQVAAESKDVNLLVNNAGVMKASSFIGTPTVEPANAEADLVTKLERLTKLRDSGALTLFEFQAAKDKLLG